MYKTRRRVMSDIAYACFLVPAFTVLIPAILEVLPLQWDEETAAGFGFFVLIPLTMLSGVCALVGIACSVYLWRDRRLPVLAAATVAMPVFFVISDETAWISPGGMTLIAVAYLVFSFYSIARWFVFARWKAPSQP